MEALVYMFCIFVVPSEMLADIRTQFTSELMAETSRLLSFWQLTTTQTTRSVCNGTVEYLNGNLKQMLRRLYAERLKDWDRYLSAALFAYRDTTHESLGFSPFELVYGRAVRELWTKEVTVPDVKSTYQYVIDWNERLESAKENLENEKS